MKKTITICVSFFILISISANGFGQAPLPDSLGLPGDNLNLYGVLSLFKQSRSVEEFEQLLNTPDNHVNNLDLNNDGQIDYIRVVDYGKGGLHSLVLQDPVNATESQDLAVIETEQRGNGVVHVQIVGDEELYGKNYIIEPQDGNQQPPQQPMYTQQTVIVNNYNPNPSVLVNVWAWPCVSYIYSPGYVYWNSPWYWGYYPHWWNPWYPFSFHAYWYNTYGYRAFHRRVYFNHMAAATHLYYGHRMASPMVHGNIVNHAYYGPRAGGREEVRPNQGNVGPRGNSYGGNLIQEHRYAEPRQGDNNNHVQPRQENNNFQPRQENNHVNAPRQQEAPRNVNGGGRGNENGGRMNNGGGGGRPNGGGGRRR